MATKREVSHYELLGVDPSASAADIREAYRRSARAHHPDTHGQQSADRMAAINDAWWVLRDPARRREYDLRQRNPQAHQPAGTPRWQADPAPAPTAEPAYNPLARYQDPPRFPWRFMSVLAACGIAVVIFGVVTYEAPTPLPPDNVLSVGSCVVFEPNGDAREVSCSVGHDAVVTALVASAASCPFGTEAHRDRQGMGIACVSTAAP